MSDVVPSPEKPSKPVTQTTYAGRMRKKRPEKRMTEEVVEGSDDAEDEPEKGEVDETADDGHKDATIDTSTDKAKLLHENGTFAVPETPARVSQKPPSTSSSIMSGSASSSKHARAASTSSVHMNPPSRESAENVSDAESQVDGSGKQRRKRKSEPERIKFFKEDPWCKELEPHRILCSQCEQWQTLHPKRRYIMRAWIAHRKSCGRAQKLPESTEPTSPVAASQTEAQTQEPSEPAPIRLKSPALSTSNSNSTSGSEDTLSAMESEGKAMLENDWRTGEIRPHEVFCTRCDTWVKLYPSTKYAVHNWLMHVKDCPAGLVPWSRTPIPEGHTPTLREMALATSPWPPEYTASMSWIQCAETAHLPRDGTSDFDGPAAPVPPVQHDEVHSNSISIEPGISQTPNASRKRSRDYDSEEEAWDQERVIRLRTNSYVPPSGVSLWERIARPIRSFFEGFRQGLSS